MAPFNYTCFAVPQTSFGNAEFLTIGSLFETEIAKCFISLQVNKWETGAPLSFQRFTNLNFGTTEHTKFKCTIHSRLGSNVCPNIERHKKKPQHTLYPEKQQGQCTMVLVYNLAEPEWISISCYEQILNNIWCQVILQITHPSKSVGSLDKEYCSPSQILLTNRCFSFVRFSFEENVKNTCCPSEIFYFSNLNLFQPIIDAIPTPLPPFLSLTNAKNQTVFNKYSYEKHLHHLWFQQQKISRDVASDLQVCVTNSVSPILGENVFLCNFGTHVSSKFLCDGYQDCPNDDKSDETHILCQETFFNDTKLQSAALQENKTSLQAFKCSSGKMLDISYVNDLVSDCGLPANDEYHLKDLLRIGKYFYCKNKMQIPCRQGHSKCFNIFEICLFRLNQALLVPCRNGAHLEDCSTFQCSATFKCHKSYCIPWEYVCDGKWDCSRGDDEQYGPVCDSNAGCPSLFKCKHNSSKCLHLGNICDGHSDCPKEDDEYSCSLTDIKCPSNCLCASWAVKCTNVTRTEVNFPFHFVVVVDSDLGTLVAGFQNVTKLRLYRTNASTLCTVNLPSDLFHFELTRSELQVLSKECFKNKKKLTIVVLCFNNVVILQTLSFINLPQLKLVNLSSNPLSVFPRNLVKNSHQLHTISLLNTSIASVHEKAFSGFSITLVETTSYHLCCVVPAGVHCAAEPPWYVSCSDLLPSSEFRILFGVIGFLVLAINLLSMSIYYPKLMKEKKSFAGTVVLTNISDGVCSLYLLVIWSADLYFKGVFLVNENLWKSSIPCFLALFLMVLFTIASQTSLLILSFSYFAVVHPLKEFTILSDSKSFFKFVGCVASVSVSTSVAITVVFSWYGTPAPMRLCSPFLDPANESFKVKAFSWFTAMSQMFSSACILCLNILLASHLLTHKEQMIKVNSMNQSSYKYPLLQLFLVSFSNILCWCPTSIVYLSVMFIAEYPIDLVIWITVCVIPINSLINPLLFVSSAKKQHRNKPKKFSVTEEKHVR